MPGYYVFPGGALEAEDEDPSGFDEALPAPEPDATDAETRDRLPVFARAALRETYEEAGLLLATPGPLRGAPGIGSAVWEAYRAAGLEPAFGALRLLARAVTPAGLPIRFHARFFLADGALAQGRPRGNGELEDLAWVPLAAAAALPMAGVTRRVLQRACERARQLGEGLAAPFEVPGEP